ncbi:MAG: acetylornithine transaminase [Thermoleophilia bacterium]|nr:acetylornithine transaminase [Thermoleophilia bacterium]
MNNIIQQYEKYIMPTYGRQPVVFVRGSGCYLYDERGHAYLDFASGLSVNNLGHCHPAVVKAVQEQVAALSHTCNLYHTPPGAELAKLISENSLNGKVFFSNSGAEANECAIKLARKHGREAGGATKHRIISLENGFHGRTMATLSATAQQEKQEPFEPLLPGFQYVPRNDIVALEAAMDDGVCAIMIEPVQGEGGVWPLDVEYLEAARRLAGRHGALLVYDEVQTGLGRTGKLFAYEHSGIEPDVLTLAKSLGGALPIGATVASPEYANVLTAGLHGSTFGGGPVPCAAGAAVMRELMAPGFLEAVQARGKRLRGQLEGFQEEGLVTDVRGLGLMLAVDLPQPRAEAVVRRSLEEKILLNNTSEGTIRFLPPLIVEEEMIERVAEFLQAALRK